MLHSLFVVVSYACYFRLPESLAFSIDILHHHRTKLSYHPTANQESSSCRNRHHGMKSIRITTRFATLSESESEVDFRINSIKPPTNPLADHTFAGQVEKAIIQKFGEESTQRVLESWRLLDMEYEHRQRIDDVSSNVNPDSSFSYQHAHSYVPGLTCKSFWNTNDFEFCEKLKKSYKIIRKEFLSITKDASKLIEEGNNVWAGALTEEAGGYGLGWKTLVLMDRGMWDSTNCHLFPKTAKAVEKSGIPCVEVFFASMEANSNILMHSDFTNFVLTSHLAIDIPDNGQNKCRLTIGDTTKEWINGDMMLFDTSIMHDAVNESDRTRYILMFRLWHPDLTEVERLALQYIYDCLEEPLLLSTNEDERMLAERRINELRTFPKLNSGSGFGGGGGARGKKQKKSSKKKR